MSDAALGAKQLMRDGQWLVPEEERPANWKSLKLREEVTVTKTTRTATLVAPPQTEVVTTSTIESVEQQDQPKLISYIPERCAAEEGIVNKSIEFWCGDPDLLDDKAEELSDALGVLSKEVERHRMIKASVDAALTQWANQHEKQLRHVGIGSTAVRDLWMVVYGLCMAQQEVKP